MSDTRLKKLFAGTENYPLYQDMSEDRTSLDDYNDDGSFPKFSRFMQNAIGNVKEQIGQDYEYYAPSNRANESRPPSERVYRTEDTPEMIKELFPAQEARYQALKKYSELPKEYQAIDRTDINKEIVRAILEKEHPEMLNNFKYNQREDKSAYENSTRNAVSKLTKTPFEQTDFDTKYIDDSNGAYDPETGEIFLDPEIAKDATDSVSTLSHELNHKQVPTEYITNEKRLDFSESNTPAKTAIHNNAHPGKFNTVGPYIHNVTPAPLTKSVVDKSPESKEKTSASERLRAIGHQYNLFENLLANYPELVGKKEEEKKPSRFEEIKKLLGL